MSIVTVTKGSYISISTCDHCGWWDKPISRGNFQKRPRSICPDCGCGLKNTIGRFTIRKIESLFKSESEVIGFTPKPSKKNGPDVPKPAGPLNRDINDFSDSIKIPDRNAEPLGLIWPRSQRESDIIKQQNDLHDIFHWYHASIGFIFGTMFFSTCYFIWG